MKQYNTSKHTASLSNRGFYTILTICGVIIAVSAWVLWSNVRNEPEEEPSTSISSPIIAPTSSMPDVKEEKEPVAENTDEPVDNPLYVSEPVVSTPAPESEPVYDSTPTVTVSAPVYVRPVEGAVITPFSGDELLYQPTLGDWRVHTGTDIAAEPGQTVLALTDGTVQDITQDDMYGTCVTISHPSDLVTTYRGLDEIRVSAGQAVSAGEAIGSCAKTIDAEAALGTHLHVEATRAGTFIDVLSLLGEYETE